MENLLFFYQNSYPTTDNDEELEFISFPSFLPIFVQVSFSFDLILSPDFLFLFLILKTAGSMV